MRFLENEKGAAGPGGRAGRAQTRSGDGEGWGRDRARVTPFSSSPSARRISLCRDQRDVFALSRSARRGGSGGRTRIAERDPDVRIVLRLPLHEAVAGLRPEQDGLVLVVE